MRACVKKDKKDAALCLPLLSAKVRGRLGGRAVDRRPSGVRSLLLLLLLLLQEARSLEECRRWRAVGDPGYGELFSVGAGPDAR